jgi:hypothetical protein
LSSPDNSSPDYSSRIIRPRPFRPRTFHPRAFHPDPPLPVFDQLYIIGLGINGVFHPILYCLLRKKTTYALLWGWFRDKYADIRPRRLMMDLETGARNAFKGIFEDTDISFCQFHFSQALSRKLQELGLQADYRRDALYAAHC